MLCESVKLKKERKTGITELPSFYTPAASMRVAGSLILTRCQVISPGEADVLVTILQKEQGCSEVLRHLSDVTGPTRF